MNIERPTLADIKKGACFVSSKIRGTFYMCITSIENTGILNVESWYIGDHLNEFRYNREQVDSSYIILNYYNYNGNLESVYSELIEFLNNKINKIKSNDNKTT